MSANLAVLLVGLFIGGLIGTLAVALVASGSEHRFSRGLGEETPLVATARASGQGEAEFFPRVDLLPNLHALKRSAEPSVGGADDIERVPTAGRT